MTRIDVGRLTAEETQSTFIDCGRNLTEEDLFTALGQILTEEQKTDLAEEWLYEKPSDGR